MNKLIKAVGGPKIAILLAVVIGAITIFGLTVVSTGGQSVAEHGHSHD